MITKEIALTLSHGKTLYHKTLKNRDGSALRARVNGKVKTWKREPDRFEIPMKRGIRNCFYITNNGAQPGMDWTKDDPDEPARLEKRKAELRKRFKLADDTPDTILRDRMLDEGMQEELCNIVCR